MTIPDPSLAGVPQAAAHVFTWLADKVLGGAKKAFGWGWERAQWIAAQDRYDEQIIKQYGWIRIFGQTTPKSLRGDLHRRLRAGQAHRLSSLRPGRAARAPVERGSRRCPSAYGERLPGRATAEPREASSSSWASPARARPPSSSAWPCARRSVANGGRASARYRSSSPSSSSPNRGSRCSTSSWSSSRCATFPTRRRSWSRC